MKGLISHHIVQILYCMSFVSAFSTILYHLVRWWSHHISRPTHKASPANLHKSQSRSDSHQAARAGGRPSPVQKPGHQHREWEVGLPEWQMCAQPTSTASSCVNCVNCVYLCARASSHLRYMCGYAPPLHDMTNKGYKVLQGFKIKLWYRDISRKQMQWCYSLLQSFVTAS